MGARGSRAVALKMQRQQFETQFETQDHQIINDEIDRIFDRCCVCPRWL